MMHLVCAIVQQLVNGRSVATARRQHESSQTWSGALSFGNRGRAILMSPRKAMTPKRESSRAALGRPAWQKQHGLAATAMCGLTSQAAGRVPSAWHGALGKIVRLLHDVCNFVALGSDRKRGLVRAWHSAQQP